MTIVPDAKDWTWVLRRPCPECRLDTSTIERAAVPEMIRVADEVATAADTLADAFAALSEAQWTRPGRRSDGASFTVESFARYFIHDPVHHLWDVTGAPA